MPDVTVKSADSLPYRPVARPRRSQWERFRSFTRGWVRSTFSRESLLSSIRTFLWVVPLTVLIWIYAEREQLAVQKNVQFTVEVRNSDPTRLIRIVDSDGRQSDGRVIADLAGPQSHLESVQQKLASAPVQIDVGPGMEAGLHKIQSRLTLTNESLFKNNGVSVTSVMPLELTVMVDRLVPVTVDVQPRPEAREALERVSFEPRQVQLSVPESFRRDHPNLVAYADLRDLTTPGEHDESVSVVPSANDAGSHVTVIGQASVQAKYSVKKKDVTDVIPAMPLWVSLPPLPFWQKYHPVPPENVIRDVTVIGPRELIDKLKDPSSDVRARATYEVSSLDLTTAPSPSTEYTASVKFDVPDGVRVADKDKNMTIKYHVVENKPTDQ